MHYLTVYEMECFDETKQFHCPAGISRSVVVLWSYFPTSANTYQKYDQRTIREQTWYKPCHKYCYIKLG